MDRESGERFQETQEQADKLVEKFKVANNFQKKQILKNLGSFEQWFSGSFLEAT